METIVFTQGELDRFWRRVSKTESCWIWLGPPTTGGYGIIRAQGRMLRVNRVSYLIHHGAIPSGLGVLHSCPNGENKLCVNPQHLYAGTDADNSRDKVLNGMSTVGETNGRAVLSGEDVLCIRRRLSKGDLGMDLADEYGISASVISEIKHNKIWSHLCL